VTSGRILVVGATGLVGTPVARQLLADGHHVRLLVRDPDRARAQLGTEFEYAPGSITDGAVVNRAVRGIDGVHVSLGVEDPALLSDWHLRRALRSAVAVAERSAWIAGRGISSSPGSSSVQTFRSARCCASSVAPPPAVVGSRRLPASSCGERLRSLVSDVGSRRTSCGTPTPSRWRTKAFPSSSSSATCQSRHHIGLPAGLR
jgi:NAD(P)-dependent dehydrogenase (short-subunit alcohol dehydrogenase family)